MKHKAIRCILYILVFSLPLLYFTGYVQNVSAASVTPQYYAGNDKDLPNEIKNLPSIKFDPATNGTKWLDEMNVTAEFSDNGMEVSFASNTPIAYVFVKAGSGGYVYAYDPPVLSDNGLYSPDNNGGRQAEISHVVFYFGETQDTIPDPDPSPSPDPSDEPTPEPTPDPEIELPDDDVPGGPANPSPTPETTPEIELLDDDVPGGPVDPPSTPDNILEIELLDDEIPGGPGELPKTGELPPVLFYGSGAVFIGLGFFLKNKLKSGLTK